MAVNPAAVALAQEKLAAFNIHNTPYQQINSQEITTDVFIPKDIKPGKYPLIVRFHGGFLITGSSLNLNFFPPWVFDFALKHSAILVSPNYVKLPESTGLDILDNLEHFWKWLRSDLQATVTSMAGSDVSVDQSQTLIIGHSAGGYLAAQSALTQPKGSIKGVVAAYPMLDMSSKFGQHPFGSPMLPASTIHEHLATMKPGEVITGLPMPPLERLGLAVAIVQHHRFPKFLGPEKPLYPIDVLKEKNSFPPLFIYHGTEDSAVDVAGTKKFVEVAKGVMDSDRMVVRLEPGDHGFDAMVGIEESWMKEGLTLVSRAWLE